MVPLLFDWYMITIPPHAGRPGSFHQDFAIDEVRGAIFIADLNVHGALLGPSDPAIVAVDLKTGRVRRGGALAICGARIRQSGESGLMDASPLFLCLFLGTNLTERPMSGYRALSA